MAHFGVRGGVVNHWAGSLCVFQGSDTSVLEEHTASIFRFVLSSQAARCRDSEDDSSNLHHEIFERNAYSEVTDCEGVWQCECYLSK
jgi:hypothetical protein